MQAMSKTGDSWISNLLETTFSIVKLKESKRLRSTKSGESADGNRKRARDYSKQESKKQQTTQREGQFTSSSGVLPVINLLAARLSDIISRKLGAWLITLNEPISHPFGPLSNSFLCRRGCWETQTWFFTFVIDHFTVYQNYYCIIWQVPYFKNMYYSRLFNNVV